MNTTITVQDVIASGTSEQVGEWLDAVELGGMRVREITFNDDHTLTITFLAHRDDGKLAVLHDHNTKTASVIECVATIPQPDVPFPSITSLDSNH